MKILYLHPSDKNLDYYNDYMSDLLLHGLREIFDDQVIDYPGCWYMYSDEILNREFDPKKLWGKGFTIKNTLNNFRNIDRDDIKKKIEKKYFDLIIYGSIRRSNLFIEDVINYNNNFIFIDGEDDNLVDEKYSKLGLYFKRELINKERNILPINFAIPKKKILKNIDTNPNNLLAPLIPGKLKTYIYHDEKSYYEMYRKSIFGITYKKAGWDCLRHYEILMNGCIPLFFNIKDCPKLTMTTIPKEQLLNIYNDFEKVLRLFNPLETYKKKFLSFEKLFHYLLSIMKDRKASSFIIENPDILEIKNGLLTYTKKNLTTENLAKYIIDNRT